MMTAVTSLIAFQSIGVSETGQTHREAMFTAIQ